MQEILGLIVVLALLAAPADGWAGQASPAADTTRLDSARVARLPGLTVSGKRPRAAPPPVTTLEVRPEALRRTQAATPYDLVRRTAGLEVHEQGQGPGYASDVVLRGFSSDHSSDVLLMLDGVPVNLPVHGHVEGYADWSVLSPAAVNSFRVINGTASPLYGDFALGGVVEVFTAPDASGLAGAFSGSSRGDAGGWVRGGHRGGSAGYLIAGDGRRQQGWRPNSAYWLGNGLVRSWHRLGGAQLETGLAGYASTWDSPGFVSVAQYNARDFDHPADPTDGGTSQRVMAHTHLTGSAGRGSLDALAWVQAVHSTVFLTIPEDGALDQSEETDRRWALGGRFQFAHPHATGDFSAGVDGRADVDRYGLFRTDQRARVSPTKSFRGRYLGGGSFVRLRHLVGQHLAFDLGARADVLHYRSEDLLDATPAWREKTRAVFGPKLGARWIEASGISLLGSFSRGFRGAPGVIEDPSVPPIEAWTTELGIRYDGVHARVSLAAFRLSVSHERILDPITRVISTRGSSVRQGLEGELEVQVAPGLTATAGGTLNDARVSGRPESPAPVIMAERADPVSDPIGAPVFHIEPSQPGDPVPNVARYNARAGLGAQLTRALNARGSVRFSGPYTPIGEPTVRTRSYAVLDLGASLELPALRAVADLEIDNALGARYPEIRASGFLNPGAPRILRIALRFPGRP